MKTRTRLLAVGLLGLVVACGSSGGGTNNGDGGSGGDGSSSGGASYKINFSSTGSITGTWAWDNSLAIGCKGNVFDITVANTGPDAGNSNASITIMGDGNFTFRAPNVTGGVKGKAS